MLKPALLACLLVMLSACASDRVIGSAYVDPGTNDGSIGGKNDEETLIHAAKGLEGPWIPRPNPLFDIPLTVTFQHQAGTRGGTYKLKCQGENCFPADAGLFSPLVALLALAEGEYKLFEINELDEAHGLLTSTENFGFFLFVPLDRSGPPGIEISNIPFVRPSRAPGSGP